MRESLVRRRKYWNRRLSCSTVKDDLVNNNGLQSLNTRLYSNAKQLPQDYEIMFELLIKFNKRWEDS